MSGVGSSSWLKTTLPKSIASIASTLSVNSEEWKPRLLALQDIEKMVLDCKEHERTNVTSPTVQLVPVTLSAHLLTLAPSLIVQITDLRSEIVRQASHTLSFLAIQLPDVVSGDVVTQGAFHKCGAKVLPALLTVAASSNSVIRSYAVTAAQDVVAHVCSGGGGAAGGILPHLLTELKHTKNKNVKSLAMELLGESVMKRWPRKLWCDAGASKSSSAVGGGATTSVTSAVLEEHLLLGLGSADTLTRAAACRAVWAYAKYGHAARAAAFFKGLEPRTKKGVLEARRAEDEGVILDVASSESVDDSALTRKRATTPVSRATNGISGGRASGGHLDHERSASINLSATSISDSILTKALADARKKAATPTPSTSTSSTTTAAAAKKSSTLGLPSRVPTKKLAVVTTATSKVRPATAAAASAPTSPPPVKGSEGEAGAEDAQEVTESGSAPPVRGPRHGRSISTILLDDLPGLLNETELDLHAGGTDESTSGIDGVAIAPSTASHSSSSSTDLTFARLGSPPTHIKNLSITSTSSEIMSLVPQSQTAHTSPAARTRTLAGSSASGSRTPRGTSSAGRSTGSAGRLTNGAAAKRSSAAVAAEALLSKTSASGLKPKSLSLATRDNPSPYAATVTPATKKRQSLPSSTGLSINVKSSTASSTSVTARRSLGSTSTSSASKSTASSAAPSEPTTPRKRLVSSSTLSSSTRRTTVSSSTSVSGATTPVRKLSSTASGRASPASLPRPSTATTVASRTPVRASPARPGTSSTTAASTTAARRLTKSPSALKPTSLTVPASAATTPALTPVSFSAYGSPGSSSLHSPQGGAFEASSLLIPSGLSSPNSASSASALASLPAELSTLLRDHRQHVAESAIHLQSLNNLLQSSTSSLVAASNTTSGVTTTMPYVDGMIKLLSDSLSKTTRLLESFMRAKRKELSAAQAQQQNQVAAAAAAAAAARATINITPSATPRSADPTTPTAGTPTAAVPTTVLPVFPTSAPAPAPAPMTIASPVASLSTGGVGATTPGTIPVGAVANALAAFTIAAPAAPAVTVVAAASSEPEAQGDAVTEPSSTSAATAANLATPTIVESTSTVTTDDATAATTESQ